jgi:RecG-like helicase
MKYFFQGDVGCGKTIVAFLALLEVIDAGFQVG